LGFDLRLLGRDGRTLQNAGVIEYGRGRITVLDREALEDESCECYRVITEEYRRLVTDN